MWMTETEVAAEMRISKKTVRRLIKSGKLVATNCGTGKRSFYRIHRDALLKLGHSHPEPQVDSLETSPLPTQPGQRQRRRHYSSSPILKSFYDCLPRIGTR